ncbi:TetR/AcrR family transcriptional regulator [Ancylobacter lacus]|uniref:TetR/AcrR family transcriptional regulator n=1 Tax=Ancylobacter lacus TaxID=2579970 RepID=UPI001BCE7426|nr:TetR/AcrR family transcriptional regulator [Ancylobacter lacus]MBS7537701.1 TetR/AcrR family transcriptional regulator [Ancylobacter lacus]
MPAAAAAPATASGPNRKDPRRRVLDAAARCFIRGGFHATSMHEVCAEAGMSPGALYRYFPSKEAIIIAIVEEERSARSALLAHLDSSATLVEALTLMGEALFSSDPPMVCVELGPEIAAEVSRNPRLRPVFDEVEDEMDAAFLRALEAAQARGEVDPALDRDHVMLMINALGDGIMLRRRLQPELPLAQMMPQIATLIGRMLAPPAPSVSSGASR